MRVAFPLSNSSAYGPLFTVCPTKTLLHATHDHNSVSLQLQGCGPAVPFWDRVPATTPTPLFAEIGSFVLFRSGPRFLHKDKL